MNNVIDIIDKNALYNNQFPAQIKFENLIIGVNDYVNSNVTLDNNTYLIVGQSNLSNYSDVTNNTYSLIIDSKGIAINSTLNSRKINRNTSNGLTIEGDILISGTLKGASPIDGSVINYTNYYTTSWKVSDTQPPYIYTDSNVVIGSSDMPTSSLDVWGTFKVNGANIGSVTQTFQSSNISVVSNNGCNLFYAANSNVNIGLSSTSNTIVNINPTNVQINNVNFMSNLNYGSSTQINNTTLSQINIGTTNNPSILSVTPAIETDILKVSAIQIGNFIIKESYLYEQGFPSAQSYLTIQDTRLTGNPPDGNGTFYFTGFSSQLYPTNPPTA
jgi:hypothetical protein